MVKIVEQQSKVKRGSKCLKWVGYALLAVAWLTMIGNFWAFFTVDAMVPLLPWRVRGSKTVHYFHLETGGLAVMCLMKAVSSIFLFKQARWTLNAVKPILKEYKDAESGATQGIKMTERRSQKFDTLQRKTKKLTCGVIVFVFFCVIYAKGYCVGEADRWIDMYYEAKMNPNTTQYGQEYIQAGYKSIAWDDFGMDEDDDDWTLGWDQPMDQYNYTTITINNKTYDVADETDDQIIFHFPIQDEDDIVNDTAPIDEEERIPEDEEEEVEPEQEIDPMPIDFDPEEEPKPHHHGKHGHHGMKPPHHGGHSKDHHKRKHKKDLGEYMDSIDAATAKRQVNMMLNFGFCFGFIWGVICLCFWQMVFLCAVGWTMRAQKKLEHRFMGPEQPCMNNQ